MLLSNPFRPDPRVHKEALSLIKAGHSVTILCWDREQKNPEKEIIDGIEIIRLGPESSYGNSRDLLFTIFKFWKHLKIESKKLNFDIIHAHDLDTLSPGIDIARKHDVPIIYDSHEIYHEMAGENLNSVLTRFLETYERRMVRKPDIVITVNEKLANVFKEYGAREVQEIMNCHPDPEINNEEVKKLRQKLSPRGLPIALYIGVVEPNRQLRELAIAHSKSSHEFLLLIGGFGSLEDDIKQIAEQSGGGVQFLGRINPAEVPTYNRAADILLATYDPALRNNRLGAPNKLFEAMAAGRPLVVSEGTFAAHVVNSVGMGESALYDGKSSLDAVSRILKNSRQYSTYSENARKAFEQKYNWGIMEQRLLSIYSKLLD